MGTHTPVYPLELGLWTPTLLHGPLIWGDGLPCFPIAPLGGGVRLPCFGSAPRVGVMDSYALARPSSCGDVLSRFGEAPSVGVKEFHTLVWPLELGSWTPTLWYSLSSLGYGSRSGPLN